MSLLNKVPRVPECPSNAQLPQVLLECSSSALYALWMTFLCPLSARVKKICNITGNGLRNSFIVFRKIFRMFYITVVLRFLGKCVIFTTFC